MTSPRTALGNRLVTLGLVASALVCFRALWPDETERAEVQYVFVLTLGYGHLLGAAVVRRRRRGLQPAGVGRKLWATFRVASVATLFAAWFALLDLFAPSEFLLAASPLLAISAWHTVENDFAVARAYDRKLALGPIDPRDHAHSFAIAGLALVTVAWLAEGSVPFADVFAATTLYHLFQWLVFLGDRIRADGNPERVEALVRGIAWAHLPPALLGGLVLIGRSCLPDLAFELVFSPSLYLFWSSLHVLQTSLARGHASTRESLAPDR